MIVHGDCQNGNSATEALWSGLTMSNNHNHKIVHIEELQRVLSGVHKMYTCHNHIRRLEDNLQH